MDWASAPNFFREDIKTEEEEPTTFMSLTSTKSGEEFDIFLDQLQDQFQDTLSSLLPFSLLSDVPSPEETVAAPTPVQPTPILDEVESPTNWGLNPHPVRNYDDDNDQPRLHFSSGEFDEEVDFRDPSSVSVSSSYRSSSPSSPRSMRTVSSRSSRTHSEATTAEDSALNAHIRNSQQAHNPFQLDEYVMYCEEPDTEEEDWPDNTSDSSESRRKRKRANSARAIIRKKSNSGQDQVPGTTTGRRATSKKAQASQESADSSRRRQRPKPPKRERKRRDWVNHPRAHEISLHIYNFLVACRKKKEKPSAADIFHANPEIFIEFGINEADKNKIGEHLRDIYRGRSTDPAGLLSKEVVWDLWYDQTRVTSSTRRV